MCRTRSWRGGHAHRGIGRVVLVRFTASSRSVWYAAAGAVLAVGAPTGLLILRELWAPRPIATELVSERVTYLYVLIATVIVLAFLGHVLGRQADRLAVLSETDALTGLPNRRALRRRLQDEFVRSKRYRTPMSLLLVDIDGLKQLNDVHGHLAGDRMIRTVAAAILAELRDSDFAARWGGDEFAILVPNTSADAARSSAERLLASVAGKSGSVPRQWGTVSIGIATYDPTGLNYKDVDSLGRAADDALYRAKAGGRNRVDAAQS
jgi:diguanylate cyclase (GGDEF)-like protein